MANSKRPARGGCATGRGLQQQVWGPTGSADDTSAASEKLQMQLSRQRLWQLQFPERRKAHLLTERAMSKGLIPRPVACEECGSTRHLDKHHPSYAAEDVLRIVVLCRGCHVRLHARERRQAREAAE